MKGYDDTDRRAPGDAIEARQARGRSPDDGGGRHQLRRASPGSPSGSGSTSNYGLSGSSSDTSSGFSSGPSVPSLGDFARDHGLELTRFAYLVSGDRSRADDLVQDVLLAMHRRFGARLELDQPVAYARRAIVNANISFTRRRSSTEVLTATDLDRPAAEDPDSDDLWSLLAGLPHRQRVVLVMRYYLGYSDAEIATTLGCRRGTVRSLASRALADLRASDGIVLRYPPDSSSHDGTNR